MTWRDVTMLGAGGTLGGWVALGVDASWDLEPYVWVVGLLSGGAAVLSICWAARGM